MNYFSLLGPVFGALMSQSGTFRVGSKRVTIVKESGTTHATFGELLIAGEMALAGVDTTVQVGAMQVAITEWA